MAVGDPEHPEFVAPKDRSKKNARTKADPAVLRKQVLGHIEEGLTIRSAMAKVGRSEETYKFWRRTVDGFAEAADKARARKMGTFVGPGWMPFEEWRTKYLKMETFPHQRQWIDVLEGRDPAELHPSMTFVKGRDQRVMINTPPFHAKSTTITIDYVTYRICMDPNVRIIIISESRDMARKMLTAIKHRLTHHDYEKMHQDYGPAGGFKVGATQWTTDLIYVGNRSSSEKDPTVEVLGIGSQIYGARADLIIMDDCATLKSSRTAGQTDKLMEFIDQDVSSRLDSKTGKLLLVGTRVGPNDVYRRLLKRDHDKGKTVWTLLAQPAVLEYAEEDEDWETLWPFLWDGVALSIRRDEIDTTTWNLVYQQQQVDEDSVFPEEAVNGCMYFGHTGALPEQVRPRGMDGLYIVAGLDPATAGHTGLVVLGVDRNTKMRWLLDVYNIKGMTPHRLRETLKLITSKFRVQEWRIEKNGLQQMISQDPEIRDIIHKGGGKVSEHHTGNNKWDPSFGVASLAPLFLGALQMPKKNLIAIPNDSKHKGVKALVDQLIAWSPEGGGKTDLVMALWFAELGARKVLDVNTQQTHLQNKWATRGQSARRRVIDLNAQQEQEYQSVF